MGTITNGRVGKLALTLNHEPSTLNHFMADVITQQCAGCGILKTAENNTAEKPWTRISGVSLGSSPQPIQVFRPTPPGQPRMPGMNWQALDFCADCAAKTTVAAVPAMYLAKTAVPEAGAPKQ